MSISRIPASAFIGASADDIAKSGYRLDKKTNTYTKGSQQSVQKTGAPPTLNLPGSGGGGPSFHVMGPGFDYNQKLGPFKRRPDGPFKRRPDGPFSRPDGPFSQPDENYTTSTGSPSTSPSGSGGTGGPSSGGGSNSGGAMAGLRSLLPGGGGSGSGGGIGAGGAMAGAVDAGAGIGAPSAASLPLDSAPPTAPVASTEMPPDMGGAQYLSGPTNGRQGLGRRIPPSLAGLLKSKVY